jgi:hypothetical protein
MDYEALDPNEAWSSDASGSIVQILPDIREKVFLDSHLPEIILAASREPESPILNIMVSYAGSIVFGADVEEDKTPFQLEGGADFAQFMRVVQGQLALYRKAKEMSLERHQLGMRCAKLVTSMVLATRNIPVNKRQDMMNLVVAAKEVILDMENTSPAGGESPELQQLECLLKLVYGYRISEESLAVVLCSPGRGQEALYLQVWWKALSGAELDEGLADEFLRSDFSLRDPLTTALVLHRLGRNEEAFELLESLAHTDEAWRYDITNDGSFELKSLRAVDYMRFDALLPKAPHQP